MKHHYIPVFYLKHWRGPDEQINVFSPDHNGIVKAYRKYPDGTGYIRDLYALSNVDVADRHRVETHFFSPADSAAAETMRHLIDRPQVPVTSTQRSAWSRFLMSLMLRDPASVATLDRLVQTYMQRPTLAMEEEYLSTKLDDDPPTIAEWIEVNREKLKAAAISMLPRLVDNVPLGNRINSMRWGTITLEDRAFPLLTSDHPIITTATLNQSDSYIALPLNERKLFVAHNGPELFDRLRNSDVTLLSQSLNKTVVAAATKYVWSRTDAALSFVRGNFATVGFPNVMERVITSKNAT